MPPSNCSAGHTHPNVHRSLHKHFPIQFHQDIQNISIYIQKNHLIIIWAFELQKIGTLKNLCLIYGDIISRLTERGQ